MPTLDEIIAAFGTLEADDLLLQHLNEEGYTLDLDAMDQRGGQLIRGSGGALDGEYVDPRQWSDDGDSISVVVTPAWTESQHGFTTDSGSLDRVVCIDKQMKELDFAEYLGSGAEP